MNLVCHWGEGHVYGTGMNDSGQLGVGDTVNRYQYTLSPTTKINPIVQLCCGWFHSMGIGPSIIFSNILIHWISYSLYFSDFSRLFDFFNVFVSFRCLIFSFVCIKEVSCIRGVETIVQKRVNPLISITS
jgi:hypothetical protein